jgi:Translin family
LRSSPWLRNLYACRFLLVLSSVLLMHCRHQARLAVNSVTLGDYERPLQISNFIKDLFAGFQLLNLKNDILRKRSDGIKYSVSHNISPSVYFIFRDAVSFHLPKRPVSVRKMTRRNREIQCCALRAFKKAPIEADCDPVA